MSKKMEQLGISIEKYLSVISISDIKIRWTDIVEIMIISFLVYEVMVWIKNTRAWSLLKGIIIILVFIFVAALFRMNTILWIVQNVMNIAVIAGVIVFQPELRQALEQLGRKKFLTSILPFDPGKNTEERFSDKTIDEIIKACFEMGKAKTGALIVMQQSDRLDSYIRTGIPLDSLISSQLLINIFEHNTPLHDGAVIVNGNRIVAATCYLPLSDNMRLSKDLGTRHRAGVGMSEATDSLIIIVSEETGRVSIAWNGELFRNSDAEKLREKLIILQNKTVVEEKKFRIWKGRAKDEK